MSDSMNPHLAAMYNTNGAAEQMTEDMQKTANAELFCKLAADQGLDLSQMSDDQVASVYAQVFPEEVAKLAEKEEGKKHEQKESAEHEKGEKEEEKEEKEVKAAAYVQEKQAWVEKCAEADHMGRIMAHAFTQEKENIETAKIASIVEYGQEQGWTEEQLAEAVKEAAGEGALAKLKNFGKAAVGAAKDAAGSVAAGRKNLVEKGERAAGKLKDIKSGVLSEVPDKAKWEVRKNVAKGVAAKYAPHAAAAVGTAAVAKGVHSAVKGKKDEEKESKASAEAFEELSANHAIKVAEAAGFDVDVAVQRVSAVHVLGIPESEKIAHVSDVETATHVRGLEYLEAAGYPVNWEEIFGS